MAQHDYNLANQSGADFRADLNNALSAIVTVNSGATEPSTTFAHQLWVDTANNVLKVRNAANNAWITTGVSITASNTFTGNITGNVTGDVTGNADTATTLATARTINGTSFDGSANISFDTDSVSEGSSNLYFTNERVDDQVNTLLQAGTGIQLTYDDTAGTLTIANTNDADITEVIAGDGLTGGGSSGSVSLSVSVDDSSIEINSDSLRVKALGITNAMLAGSIANAKLSNSSVTINSNALSLGGTLTLDTDDVSEGTTNLYYTDTRANSAFDTRLATKDTDDLSEGTSNLYYTQARFDSAFTAKSTSDLSEGTNLYYTDARARASISEDSTQLSYNSTTGVLSFTQGDTDTVSEGSSNLYFTNARARSAISASGDISYNSSTGVISFTQTTAPVTSVNTQTGAVVLDTDDISEGSTNLYYTDTRANSAIDTRVTKSFVDGLNVQAASVDANSVTLGTDTTGNYVATITGTANKVSVSGSGSESATITLSLPDDVQIADSLTVAGNLTVNGTLTSLDTTNLDIEDNLFQLNAGLTGSPVNDSGMLINRGSSDNGIFMWDESADKFTLGLTTADGSATGNITLSSLGTLVANLEGDVTGDVTGTVSSISNHSTSDLSEGTNLYYTDARFDTRLGTKDTDDVSEGSSNLYYTTARFNSAFSSKSTSDLSEGSNLYYTDARANSAIDTRVTKTFVDALNIVAASATGNAGTATALATARDISISGDITASAVSFDGTGNVALSASIDANTVGITEINVTDGSSGQVLTTDGAGNLSFSSVSGTTINNNADNRVITGSGTANTLNGEANFVFDGTNVGIGQSAPSAKIHATIEGSVPTISSNTVAVFNRSGGLSHEAYVSIIGGTSGASALHFGDTADEDVGRIEYRHDSNYMAFNTNAAERMRIDSSGNVGIGTTGAEKRLHITDSTQANQTIRFGNPSATPYGEINYDSSGFEHLYITSKGTTTGYGNIVFNTGATPSEAMRIDASGNVGIGAAPNYTLGVHKASASSNYIQITNSDTGSGSGDGFLIGVASDEAATIWNQENTRMVFGTNGTERMRIDSSGRLLIGQTSAINSSILQAGGNTISGGVAHFFDSDVSVASSNVILKISFTNDDVCTDGQLIAFHDLSNQIGSIRAGSGTTVNYNTSSDERLKENIVDASSQLDVINNIQVREFDWKKGGHHDVGMIAQELNNVIPNVVTEGGDDVSEQPYSIDYGKLTPYLIKAMQEQQTIIDDLKTRIEALEG